MEGIIEVSGKEEFVNEVNSDTPVIVDFWAVWCNPCRMQAPILNDLKKDLGDKVKVIKVNIDEEKNEPLAIELGIVSIPTLAIYKNGELKEKLIGLTTGSELKEVLEKYS